jgi:hypothetical protein
MGLASWSIVAYLVHGDPSTPISQIFVFWPSSKWDFASLSWWKMVSLLCYSLKLCHPVGSPFRDFPIHFINLIKELPRLPLGLSRSLNRPHALISAVACPHPLSMDVPPWSSPYASLGRTASRGWVRLEWMLRPQSSPGSTWKWSRHRHRSRLHLEMGEASPSAPPPPEPALLNHDGPLPHLPFLLATTLDATHPPPHRSQRWGKRKERGGIMVRSHENRRKGIIVLMQLHNDNFAKPFCRMTLSLR